MKIPLLDLKGQYATLREEIKKVMDEICDSQSFILGKWVEKFEQESAEYCGAKYAIGVSSGTDALLVSLMSLGIGRGDAVITTPFTFFATAGSIARLGATPVFVDIDEETFNISARKIEELLKNIPQRFSSLKIKAILPVHLFGQCADMALILELAKKYNLKVIEDACQAIGAEYRLAGKVCKAGAMGELGCFSFFPSKNLGGFGDGGLVITNDGKLYEKIKALRNHGSSVKYIHPIVGGNFRLDALQAGVLSIKLRKLDCWHSARRSNAELYMKLFAGTAVRTPVIVHKDSGLKFPHIFNQFVVRVSSRDKVKQSLLDAGIGCDIYYPIPLHLQECFSALGYREGDFPASEKVAKEVLALPVYPELSQGSIEEVAKAILKYV
jgi:dTDP-4-amino-4,6-dideoxygalactose transaminase